MNNIKVLYRIVSNSGKRYIEIKYQLLSFSLEKMNFYDNTIIIEEFRTYLKAYYKLNIH